MSRRRASLLLASLLLLLVAASLPGESYSNDTAQVLDNATSCGDDTGCHGPASANTALYIEGPTEIDVNQVGYYNATLVGGPGQAYGFYILVTNSNGISKTIDGELLVPVTTDQTLNVTQDAPLASNTLGFNLTAPKYAGAFTIKVVYNSVNGDGLNSSADEWNVAVFQVQVVYPREVVHWRTFWLGLAALVTAALTTLWFRHLKLKLVI